MTNARISLLRWRPRCPRREVRAPHNTRQAVLLSHGRFAQAAAQQRGLRLLFSWIYDIPSLLAIILFVAVFWLGFLLLRPFVRRLLPQERGLNATLTMYLQYFGIIYGLLLGLLAVGAY